MNKKVLYVGLDVHKKTTDVAIAPGRSNGKVRSYSKIDSTVDALNKLIKKLEDGDKQLRFVSTLLLKRQQGLPKGVCDISWKAQTRLCARYRRLMARGKTKQTVITAIARELSAFIWAIDKEMQVAHE